MSLIVPTSRRAAWAHSGRTPSMGGSSGVTGCPPTSSTTRRRCARGLKRRSRWRGVRRASVKRDPFGGSSRTPLHDSKAMKAFVVDRYKSKSAVRLGEMPEPEVRDDDVLVQVHAASLNHLDSKIRDGEFKLIVPYRLPLILGNDVAGVVVRVGSNVRRFKPGDEVYARPRSEERRVGKEGRCRGGT